MRSPTTATTTMRVSMPASRWDCAGDQDGHRAELPHRNTHVQSAILLPKQDGPVSSPGRAYSRCGKLRLLGGRLTRQQVCECVRIVLGGHDAGRLGPRPRDADQRRRGWTVK